MHQGIPVGRIVGGLLSFALQSLASGFTFAQSSAVAAPLNAKEPLTVVYWTARNCRWRTWWEGKVVGSGGEAKFLASPEGKAVRYVVLKKSTLAVAYREEDFSSENKWLWERMQASNAEGEGRIRGFPSFSLFEGKTRSSRTQSTNPTWKRN
jgi:hypothetical protein